MRTRNLLLHLANIALPLLALARVDHPALAAAASLGVFFGCFALAHDAMHGSLGLSRRANDLLLLVAGASIGVSGHAARFMHLRHHARPLADDDYEGRGARGSLLGALVLGPGAFVSFPRIAWREAHARTRPWQLAGWGLVLASLGVCLALGGNAHALALTVVACQLTISAWGSHLPHRGPASLLRLAAALDGIGSSLPIGLAHHGLHHAWPRVPCFDLPRLEPRASLQTAALPPRAPRAGRRAYPLQRLHTRLGLHDVHGHRRPHTRRHEHARARHDPLPAHLAT